MKYIFMFGILLGLMQGCGSSAYSHEDDNAKTEYTIDAHRTPHDVQTTPDKTKDKPTDTPRNPSSVSNNTQTRTNGNLENGKELYVKCGGCHGKNGEKHALGKSDIIAGQNKDVTISQLKDYRGGRLNKHGMGALMKGQVASFSNTDIKNVARYIETLSGYESQ